MRLLYIFVCTLLLSTWSLAQNTVADIVINSPDHETLEAAVITADLAETLSGEGPFTVFAPTDDAFAALPDGLLDSLLTDTLSLRDILLYHVVGAEARSTDLSDGQMVTTVLGKNISISISGDTVMINDAMVTVADLEADNGIVHVIDAVLVPPRITVVDVVVGSEDHETLEAAVIAADLAGTLSGDGPFTVFAPTDDAFAALPDGLLDTLLADPSGDLTDILLYHVIGAEVLSTDLTDGMQATTLLGKDIMVTINMNGVFINEAQVTVADIETDNGVVHVIDAVLVPPVTTVVDVVVNSPVHETLEAAVIAANLAETLSGDGPFTVFAPTDSAFSLLPAGMIENLLADPSGDLTDILLYHVLGAEVLSSDLSDGMTATTLLGEDITVSINMNGVFINDAQVTVADIETDNGVVHVIDAVLVPPVTTVVDVIVNSPDHETLEAAVLAADLATTLSGEGPFTVFAPTDAAFDMLPEGVLDTLLTDPSGDLTDILLYHVVGAEVLSTDLSDGMTAMTLLGEEITISISGDTVFINDAMVTVADIATDNGVVHVIDAVLLPPAPLNNSVADIIANSEVHNTLEAAIDAAGLTSTLDSEGSFTVFAPTDDAFAALPAGLLDTLLADPSGDLTQILLYHVLGDVVLSTDLSDGLEATTLQGSAVTVSISGDTVMINDAMVTIADIEADNGVVHVIDAILLPDLTTSVQLLGDQDINIQVFPNPSSTYMEVNILDQNFNFEDVQLTHISGQSIYNNFIDNNTHTIYTSQFPKGTYLLQLTGDQVIYQRLVVIQ